MKKIINFLSSVGGKVTSFANSIKKKVFKKSEEKKVSFANGLRIGLIFGLIIFSLAGGIWYFWNGKKADSNVQGEYLAQAKVYVLTHSSCKDDCWDTDLFIGALTEQGINVVSKKTIKLGWFPFSTGKRMAKKYRIDKLPTVLVEFVGKDDPELKDFFSEELGRVINNKFVLGSVLAPYYNLDTKKIEGSVEVVYITDESCDICYDVRKHDMALNNLGIRTDQAKTFDISSAEGKELVEKYSITKVPTALLKGEMDAYKVFKDTWQGVGIIAADGTHIFLEVDLMGDFYRNLMTGEVMKADTDKYMIEADLDL